MMSIYMIQNDEGKFLSANSIMIAEWLDTWVFAARFAGRDAANNDAKRFGGHVVEVGPLPAPVAVTKAEADLLSAMAGGSAYAAQQLFNRGNGEEIKKYWHAIANHWEVEKPKRFVLPMPESEHMSMGHRLQSYAIHYKDKWYPRDYISNRDAELAYGGTVTQADIDTAPAWVKAIKPVEVRNED